MDSSKKHAVLKSFLAVSTPSCGPGSNPYKECPPLKPPCGPGSDPYIPCVVGPINPVGPLNPSPLIDSIADSVNRLVTRIQFAYLLERNLNLDEREVGLMVDRELRSFENESLGVLEEGRKENRGGTQSFDDESSLNKKGRLGALELMMIGAKIHLEADNLCEFHALKNRLSKTADKLINEGFNAMG